jgi:hypothetical protein
VLANSAELSGKLLLAPGSLSGGASSTMLPAPAAMSPAQFEIQVVRMSAQASLLASQQL